MSWKVLEGFAVLFYGALTLVLLFVFSLWHGAFYAGATTILAAALTYVYQSLLLDSTDADGNELFSRGAYRLKVLHAIVLGLCFAAFLLAIFGV